MSKLLVVAFGTCHTCTCVIEAVGSSRANAEYLLRNGHGKKHIFHGKLEFKGVTYETARRIERRRVP